MFILESCFNEEDIDGDFGKQVECPAAEAEDKDSDAVSDDEELGQDRSACKTVHRTSKKGILRPDCVYQLNRSVPACDRLTV